MKKVITAFFLFSFCFSGLLNAKESPWQLRESREGIPVYTREVEGSPILEYKAKVVLDAPLQKVLDLFEDERQIRSWYYQCVRSDLVKKEGPQHEVIYLILDLPWPVVPRDFVFRRTRLESPDGTVTYSLKALPDRLPLAKGMIRVNSIKSTWQFKALSQGKTELYFQQHTDPAGSIPTSIINRLAVDTPFYTLRNFRKLLTGKDSIT